ncbi:MAG: hypothetical protein DI556_13310 [Rhodovulum sulfidophilum]|uniref:Uncharacterized protein n=1 Tax=Rhodovulum sulfidophilum TaxID=35806 RepID=A0A2W5PVH9_RHOSU|nr:MAG: hypothetical protein DI556_13310 [Rhodovulum sulfidophilum]
MADPPYLRLVHDKSAPPEAATARPKRRRRAKASVPSDPASHAAELAALRKRLSELERESLRDNHVICAAVFLMSCAYFGFVVWQHVAAMP